LCSVQILRFVYQQEVELGQGSAKDGRQAHHIIEVNEAFAAVLFFAYFDHHAHCAPDGLPECGVARNDKQ